MNTPIKHKYFRIVLLVILIFGITSMLHIKLNGTGEETVRDLIQWTGKISAILFSIAFGLGAIHYFIKNNTTAFLLKHRPHFGLAFAVSHTYHLFFLIWLQNMIHPVFTLAKTSSLLAGGSAYFFMYLMVITTFPKIKSKLNTVKWKALHLIGGYWIWIIFFNSYFKNVMNKDRHHLLFAMLVLVFILRIAHLTHRKIKA